MRHLSDLDLDTRAARLALDPERAAHLETCDHCRARLASITRDAELARAAPRFRAGLTRVAAVRPKPRWPLFAIPVLVAALALVIAWPRPQPETRVKGDVGAWLVRHGEDVPRERLTIGDTVTLRLSGTGRVALVDRDGVVVEVTAGTELRVTPGDFVLLAVFGDAIVWSDVADAIARGLARCPAHAVDLDCLEVGHVPGERARHQAYYVVEPSPRRP